MKRYLSIGLAILTFLTLAGCSYNNRNPMINADMSHETWMREVDTNPNKWTRGADHWFLTGDPNAKEVTISQYPYSAAVSTMSVRVPDFSNIKVNGDFQVQIFGTYGSNSVYVYGPNEAVRGTIIEVRGNTLCVDQARKVTGNMRNVIVRIGVNRLQSLTQLGRGTVEGIQLRSDNLTVTSMGSGNVYLAGNMNLRSLVNLGAGCVSVFGANTPELDIKTAGTGVTNVSGNVGVRSIMHHGRTDVNIIGANSNNLKIYADGRGKVGIYGIVNLREVKAKDFTQVYAYRLNSTEMYAYAHDKARIGLAGVGKNIYIDAFKSSCVLARNLCADTAFVRAHQNAHINIAAGNKIFAAATENSSVYFFGSPNIMSQFVSGNGTVIPVWSAKGSMCPIVPMVRPVGVVRGTYKGENYKGERMSGFPYSRWKQKRYLKGAG
ncbi:hypothetical protein AQUSIP_21110 [Aquicella siphonis]|uniref:Putative auto-transporter adhesin head GIN domain-containing protein n=1 Tax=Aquicella siphonis TaxID=254247 RepID=A0A5E4PIL1_9COXI|nr:DUF2807 domain-containing protein [Aquicella siphonis]VVC76784.1 hypothetical protein AQUSIP_21110 [Aquicella siphonis]